MSCTNSIHRLQGWYRAMCNGDWEHTYGINISTIDNPGWQLRVDIKDTILYGKKLPLTNVQREDMDDWLTYEVDGDVFDGCCGPENLEELVGFFLLWANKETPDLS